MTGYALTRVEQKIAPSGNLLDTKTVPIGTFWDRNGFLAIWDIRKIIRDSPRSCTYKNHKVVYSWSWEEVVTFLC